MKSKVHMIKYSTNYHLFVGVGIVTRAAHSSIQMATNLWYLFWYSFVLGRYLWPHYMCWRSSCHMSDHMSLTYLWSPSLLCRCCRQGLDCSVRIESHFHSAREQSPSVTCTQRRGRESIWLVIYTHSVGERREEPKYTNRFHTGFWVGGGNRMVAGW